MNSKEFINEVKDEAPFIDINDHDKWYVKEEDALKAMQMAVDEEKENTAENTIYSIKKGDFITIYNPTENRMRMM